jgi:Large eukaryotic DNA virus major capsid protein
MSTGGGLLDLVARGKKDTFFTQNPKISFFHSVYTRSPAFTQEVRLTQPRNRPEWGRWTDFDLDPIGDIVRNPVLLIDLPAWLPATQAAAAPTAYTTDLSGVEFGYTQDVGALMIEKIQVFNDQIMLHEFWGQWLEWRTAMLSNSTVYGRLGGRHPPGIGQIGKASTPKQLRIYLPILGCQTPDDKGFPMVAAAGQRFRIRVYLRRLEEIIETSDSRLYPKPWSQTFLQKTARDEDAQEFRTKPRESLTSPVLQLETTQIYLPRDAQELIKKTKIAVPYTQVQLSQFTIESNKWDPVVNNNVTVSLPLPLDFIGSVQRLTVGLQTEAAVAAGQRYDMSPPPGGSSTFVQSLRLNVGTQDRLNRFSAPIYREVANYYKNQKEPRTPTGQVLNIYTLTFGPAETTIPLGTFNMSRTQNAILYIDLAAIAADPRLNSRKTFVYVFAEAWNLFEIENGKGKMLFAD